MSIIGCFREGYFKTRSLFLHPEVSIPTGAANGSSPIRGGQEGENDCIAQAQGGIPPGAGQPRREKSGVPERWPGFRKAPVPDLFA
ncbi:MAG: hypothetical protein HXY45_12390 [Syntrophaceae bacterium]|nr:hypothetical protein [Syntrophaceae bacterium]